MNECTLFHTIICFDVCMHIWEWEGTVDGFQSQARHANLHTQTESLPFKSELNKTANTS
jgi:hypothetical protein